MYYHFYRYLTNKNFSTFSERLKHESNIFKFLIFENLNEWIIMLMRSHSCRYKRQEDYILAFFAGFLSRNRKYRKYRYRGVSDATEFIHLAGLRWICTRGRRMNLKSHIRRASPGVDPCPTRSRTAVHWIAAAHPRVKEMGPDQSKEGSFAARSPLFLWTKQLSPRLFPRAHEMTADVAGDTRGQSRRAFLRIYANLRTSCAKAFEKILLCRIEKIDF